MEVRPYTGAMGAEIRGVDLRRLDDDAWPQVRRAFHEHLVVTFPDQNLTPEQHLAFARRFGELLRLPQLRSVEGFDELQLIKREADDTSRVIGENWHADSTYFDRPPAVVVMRAVSVPDFGGDTGFANQYLAYEMLSEPMKRLLEGLKAVHSATRIFGSAYRAQGRKFSATDSRTDELSVEMGDRERAHPIVRTHPETGRKALFVNKTYVQRIDGLTDGESTALLNHLYEHIARFDITCRIRWSPNQVLVWDNRCTLHRAVADYQGKARHLVRATIAGDEPA